MKKKKQQFVLSIADTSYQLVANKQIEAGMEFLHLDNIKDTERFKLLSSLSATKYSELHGINVDFSDDIEKLKVAQTSNPLPEILGIGTNSTSVTLIQDTPVELPISKLAIVSTLVTSLNIDLLDDRTYRLTLSTDLLKLLPSSNFYLSIEGY